MRRWALVVLAACAGAEEGVCADAVCLLQTQHFMQKCASQQRRRFSSKRSSKNLRISRFYFCSCRAARRSTAALPNSRATPHLVTSDTTMTHHDTASVCNTRFHVLVTQDYLPLESTGKLTDVEHFACTV